MGAILDTICGRRVETKAAKEQEAAARTFLTARDDY